MLKKVNDIYVITLNKDKLRLEHFIEQAKKINLLNYDVFEGIDGEKLELTSQLQEILKTNDYSYRSGIVGCALSHYYLWRKIINTEKNILIFEDDVIFNNCKFDDYWNSIVEYIPDDFGIVYLNKGINLKSYPIENKYFSNIFNDGCMTACGYYINSKMAKLYNDYIFFVHLHRINFLIL